MTTSSARTPRTAYGAMPVRLGARPPPRSSAGIRFTALMPTPPGRPGRPQRRCSEASMPSGAPATTPRSTGRDSSDWQRLGEAGDGGGGAGQRPRATPRPSRRTCCGSRASCGPRRRCGGRRRAAPGGPRRRSARRPRSPRRLDEADVAEPAAAVVERELLALREVDDHAVEPAAGDAREDALAALRDGDVREAADREVQDRLVVEAAQAQGADHREGGEVDAHRLEPGGADGVEEVLHHVPPRRDEQDPSAARPPRPDRARTARSR